jgi:phenylpropionate dioxygenase-like ring-hydroxylating dioxygenase large terminal subunit
MSNPPSLEVVKIRAELAALQNLPRSRARAMSAGYYTSADYLELERQQLFHRQWICVGHEGEVLRPGDYFTTELVGEQLLVVRESGGDVRVLSNVCRHRGNVVARNSGHAERFVCGYHGWTYGIDGRLLAAPLIANDEHFDKRACSLRHFPSERWQGFIFVNLDGTAPPLTEALAATEPYIRNYHPADRYFLYGAEETWNTNWKCLLENFMEGYHLSPTHAKTLHAITPTALCEKLPDGLAFTGYRANFHPTCPERGPYPPDLTDQERRSDVFYCVYPSFGVGFCPHFTLYMCLRPLTVDTVGIRWGVTGVPSDPDAPVVKDYVALCKAFCEEDRIQLEWLQKGLKSRYYNPGPLAPDNFEGTVWDLLQYMARRLGYEDRRVAAPTGE